MFGVVGMLCGLPFASVIYVLFKQIVQEKLEKKKMNLKIKEKKIMNIIMQNIAK